MFIKIACTKHFKNHGLKICPAPFELENKESTTQI